MAAMTAVPNTPAITLQPTGPGGSTSLNPVYQSCDPANGNYATATGRDLFTFYSYPATSAPGYLVSTAYGVGTVVNFSGDSAAITNVAIVTNIATLTATNTFTAGEVVTISGLSTATYLNGQSVTVTASSGTTFTFTFAHSDASTADSGTASNTAGVFRAIIANQGQKPHTPAAWAVYTDSQANITVYSAPDTCTGRKSDVTNYNVPLGAGSVEFLVLPSSVFTQSNGQIQFLASSSLVSVYVRSL